jgi:hypothetical protein
MFPVAEMTVFANNSPSGEARTRGMLHPDDKCTPRALFSCPNSRKVCPVIL